MARIVKIIGMFLPVLMFAMSATAQWNPDPAANTPVAATTGDQYNPEIVSLGAAGFIVCWHDGRVGNVADVYVQRFDADGFAQWTADGVPLSTAAGHQWTTTIAADGLGGAVVAWQDERAGSSLHDIYAARVNPSGTPLWTANGVPVSIGDGHHESPTIASDGAGGAFVGWGGTNLGVQYLNASGVPQWIADGLILKAGSGMYAERWPKIVPDDSGGAIIAWQSDVPVGEWNILAQRVTPSGTTPWGPPVVVSAAAGPQEKVTIVPDGSGGVIATWEDGRSGGWDIYAQKIDRDGVAQWTADGVPVCTAPGDQRAASMHHGTVTALVSDGGGGAVITWQDNRSGDGAIYAQRLDGSGTALWATNGVRVSAIGGQMNPSIASDDSGGAVIVWESLQPSTGQDLYAQRVDSAGVRRWTPGGVPVTSAANLQERPRIASTGDGAAVAVWWDTRSGSTADVYIQKIIPEPYEPEPQLWPVITSAQDVPNDQGGALTLVWVAVTQDTSLASTPFYSIWRSTTNVPDPPGAKYRTTVFEGKEYAWEWIANQPAHQFASYSFTAPTLFDSMDGTNGIHYFLVSAHTGDTSVFYDSPVDSGYSVDNLAPLAPSGLSASVQVGTAVQLTWDLPVDADVRQYTVHRSGASGFVPGEANRIGIAAGTEFTDGLPVIGAPNFYRVRAVDVHGNAGPPSVEVSAEIVEPGVFAVNEKWNIVSVPLTMENYTKTDLFPGASSHAFAYDGGYVAWGILENGKGYWVKFPSAGTVAHTGTLRTESVIPVAEGWNLVGSLSVPLPVSSVGSTPGGIVTSSFFRYEHGYAAASVLEPGEGYWVKSSQAGQLILNAAAPPPASQRIRVEDRGEVPPPPPGDEASVAFPEAYGLAQNFPNPFNPVTSIGYTLPAGGPVRLTVFNVLGQEVAVLADGYQEAGFKTAVFDASGLPSGIYTCRISAGEFSATMKMLLLR